jgi:uncharacterized protein (TIGR03083 family)
MSISIGERKIQNALDIPKVTHTEAGQLAQKEYERVLVLLETLAGDDWQQQTYCTEWNVRDMVAHLAGGVSGSTSFAEFKRQNISNPYLKQYKNPVDGTNRMQIEDRAGKTTAELITEFRQNGQIGINNRKKLPWLIRKIHLPMGPLGFSSLEYLMDVIYPRDEWMHRYDICAATGKKMVVTPEHDGRMVAIVLYDLARKLNKTLGSRTILLQLTGPLAADYQFGRGSTPDCTIAIDCFDFNLRASGRISPEEAAAKATIDGDQNIANWFLEHLEVPY